MSKSLGNSPDPLDLIEKYGADGLRHGIMSIAPKGQDIRFSEEHRARKKFCNKHGRLPVPAPFGGSRRQYEHAHDYLSRQFKKDQSARSSHSAPSC